MYIMPKDIQIILQNNNDGSTYDISDLCTSPTYSQSLSDQPGKFTCTLQQDPHEVLKLVSNGSIIRVTVDGYGLFYGYIFKNSKDATETYKITAYDQARYLKNEEIYVTKNLSASGIFSLVCSQVKPAINYSVKHATSFIVAPHVHDKQSRFAIIDYGINQHLVNQKEFCFIRDDFGTLIFSELQMEKTPYILGEKSLLTSYQYDISIDSDTFNEVKVYQDDKKTGKRDVYIVKDSNNQKKWGQLRWLEKAGKDMNPAQITQLANELLSVKNRETKTMKLNAFGIKEFRAGTGFILKLDSLNIFEYMWVKSITHHFQKDYHTMEIEVFIV